MGKTWGYIRWVFFLTWSCAGPWVISDLQRVLPYILCKGDMCQVFDRLVVCQRKRGEKMLRREVMVPVVVIPAELGGPSLVSDN